MDLMPSIERSSRTERFVVTGGAVGALFGGIVGLVIGLNVYAPTAWFAAFEVGIPAAILGGLLSLLGAVATNYVGRHQH